MLKVGYENRFFLPDNFISDIFRHSTDREVALMMLMAYLSYILAEVRFPSTLGLLQKTQGVSSPSSFNIVNRSDCFRHTTNIMMVYLMCIAAFLFEWHSHCILLWDCDVPLHLAQCDREFKSHDQV